MKKVEKEFQQISEFIDKSRNAAVGFMNYAAVATYWAVGAFVSSRLKSAAWGSKTVVELGDYLKTRNPKLKGFGRRQIYNMVEFYETYSSAEFRRLYEQLKLEEFVQLPTAQTTDDGAEHSSLCGPRALEADGASPRDCQRCVFVGNEQGKARDESAQCEVSGRGVPSEGSSPPGFPKIAGETYRAAAPCGHSGKHQEVHLGVG